MLNSDHINAMDEEELETLFLLILREKINRSSDMTNNEMILDYVGICVIEDNTAPPADRHDYSVFISPGSPSHVVKGLFMEGINYLMAVGGT